MIKKVSFKFSVLMLLISVFSGCSQKTPESKGEEYYTYGETTIVSDESLFPIVDDQQQVFHNSYKRAKINMVYKPLQEALNLFVNDSIDIAILPRMLTAKEAEYFERKKIRIRATKFATDGVALITGVNNNDSLITKQEIIDLLSGKSNKGRVLVFDNPQSSTVEYLMEMANVKELPKESVYALKSNQEVIAYIKNNPAAIGVVSVNWIKRPTPEIVEDVAAVKFIAVRNDKGEYKLPSLNNLKVRDYPLVRDLYLIDCQGKAGLGTGFAGFLAGDIGQRIILKSGLAPDSLPSRQINIVH
jgi:phosphate transport system substrate-binding protein